MRGLIGDGSAGTAYDLVDPFVFASPGLLPTVFAFGMPAAFYHRFCLVHIRLLGGESCSGPIRMLGLRDEKSRALRCTILKGLRIIAFRSE